MIQIFTKLSEELAAGRGAVLATIVAEEGSAPRGAGAQMLVGTAGQLAGTIGGICRDLLSTPQFVMNFVESTGISGARVASTAARITR